MTELPIYLALQRHAAAYQGCGLEMPPFRITRQEWKQLWPYVKDTIPEHVREKTNYDDIANFMGIDLEIVTVG